MKHQPVQTNPLSDQPSIIKVIGVGGGGSNAVNYMLHQGIQGVDFVVCNTDSQVLEISPVPVKVQLGANLTKGLGAGNNPEVGKNAALESVEEVKKILQAGTRMVFITAGMGGGTGTGAAPVIAGVAKDLGILSVGIVTIPFWFEGPTRREQAHRGVLEMQKNVDTLLIICNDKIREMFGDMDIDTAFSQADNVLSTAAKGIAEIITVPGKINVDFEDVKTVMTNGGVAIMGSACSEGENRARKSVEKALTSPLLNDNKINGAIHILLDITYGKKKVTMDEVTEITEYIHSEAGKVTNMIWGHAYDEKLGEKLNVTIIATGYPSNTELLFDEMAQLEKHVKPLGNAPLTINPSGKNDSGSLRPDFPENENRGEPLAGGQEKTIQTSGASAFRKKTLTGSRPAKEQTSFNFESLHKAAPDEVSESTNSYQKERTQRLKDMSYRKKPSSNISDIEREPAFIRRNVKLDATPHSSENEVSRTGLSIKEDENGKKTPEIKPGNSFLHDNVD